MRPILIYFRETHLDENKKFTLDFSDHEFVQEIEFWSGRPVLLKKGPALMLKLEWYIKDSNHTYMFTLYPEIIDNYSYKYEFWVTKEKTIRSRQIYSPYSPFLGKGFKFEREVLKGLNIIVWLNKDQTLIESFFLHRSPKGGTEYLNFFGGKAYYRDINLYFGYDTQNKQWFSSGPEFF